MPDQLLNPEPEVSDRVRETEFEILEQAFRDKPDKEEGQEAAAEPDPEQGEQAEEERPRDEQGRFAKAEPKDEKAETPADQQQAAPEGDKQPEGKDDGDTVPRWRLREIAEERRQAQAEAQQLRAELARLQVQRQQPQQPAQQQPEYPDPLLDYPGFAKQMADQMRAEFQQVLRVSDLNNNLRFAHMRHGESFEKAYSALLKEGQNGNGQLVQHLTAQGNPGEAIVSWYKQGELLRETNGDLGAFKTKVREELRKDPEFIKTVFEDARAIANGGTSQGQQGQHRNNITQLPPSLSRATGSAANSSDPIDTDDSDGAVFNFAFK